MTAHPLAARFFFFVGPEAAADSGRGGLLLGRGCDRSVHPRVIGRPVDWPAASRDKTDRDWEPIRCLVGGRSGGAGWIVLGVKLIE